MAKKTTDKEPEFATPTPPLKPLNRGIPLPDEAVVDEPAPEAPAETPQGE